MPLLSQEAAGVACPQCKEPCDAFGDHLVSCRRNHLLARHTGVQDALLRILEGARIPCLREQGVGEEGNERPTDILLLHWQRGTDAAVDITVTHAAQPGEYTLTEEKMARHVKGAEELKVRKNGPLCDRLGWSCVPFGMDTWGTLGPSARSCWQQVVKRATAALEGWERAQKVAELHQNLATALADGIGRQLGVVIHVLLQWALPPAPSPTPHARFRAAAT